MNSISLGNAVPVLPLSPRKNDDTEDERLLEETYSQLRFRHPLRKYQTEILDLVSAKVSEGRQEIHIVAPPGAGKTIIGLQMVLNFKKPALILSPNTTIQAQWSQKLDLFIPPETQTIKAEDIIGTHEGRPLKPITVLTYQVLSTPGREQEYLEQLAQKEWVNELRTNRAYTVGEAELRILELLQNNPKAHQREMSRHASRIRKKLTEVMKLEEVLHKNALDLIQALRRQGVGLVIFDECHHLTDYWAAIMVHILRVLDEPLVVALTGTPPEGKTSSQENRYMSLVGNIDYQVPTPALVREGGLAPFQDLVYFTEPTVKELEFLESQHQDFHVLINELTGQKDAGTKFSTRLLDNGKYDVIDQSGTVSPLLTWVLRRTIEASEGEGWQKFQEKRLQLSISLIRTLYKYKLPIPKRVVVSGGAVYPPVLDDWMCILDDFASHKLKVSAATDNHELFEKIKIACRKLGYGISERGLRKQASPADRVLAFSKSKAKAVSDVLTVEYASLQNRLRAIVVTDFEKMSATGLKQVNSVLDEESGGAVGVFRDLLQQPISADVHPCLVTGSLLLIDFRIKNEFTTAAMEFLANEGLKLPLSVVDSADRSYCEIIGQGSEWESRLYVRLATELFERGISRCLIGTRGLFGEGWDSQALNTLLDLTTTTAPVSVKQLRGRSIRIQTNDPLGHRKVANNWDVVCVAPQLEKGLNDYNRFVRKHEGFYGISDDGQIERGVGHVHPSLSEMTALEVFRSHDKFNKEMAERAALRDDIYDLWKVGLPYENKNIGCVELSNLSAPNLTPPSLKGNVSHNEHAEHMRSALAGVWGEYAGVGTLASTGLAIALASTGTPLGFALLPFAGLLALGLGKYRALQNRFRAQTLEGLCHDESLKNVATAVLSALKRRRILRVRASAKDIAISERSNGCYRVILNNVDSESSAIFVNAVTEAFAPITGQPYVIPRYEFQIREDKPKKPTFNSPTARRKDISKSVQADNVVSEPSKQAQEQFFRKYLADKIKPTLSGYHAVPAILAKSQKGREAFQDAWNKHVSPGEIIETENNQDVIKKYFGAGPNLAKRTLWE